MLTSTWKRGLTCGLVLSFLLVAYWEIQLQFNPLKDTIWNYSFNLAIAAFYLVAAVAAFWSLRNLRPTQASHSILRYLGAAAAFWAIAFAIWAAYNLVLEREVPYPSLADAFFILAYPFLGLALWKLHISYGTRPTDRTIGEAMVMVAISAALIFVFLNRPDVSADLGLTKNLLNVAYSLGDVLLLTMAFLQLRSGQAAKYPGLYLLVIFLLLQVAADALFSYRNNASIYWNGDIADLYFATSGLVFALTLINGKLLKDRLQPARASLK
jgi:hypothetical protein